jgi:nucleoside-diphosphate-sugar epimerase
MNILVTGGHGWTAEAILARLGAAGYRLITFDRPGTAPPKPVRAYLAASITGDIRSRHDVAKAAALADAVVHLAVAIDPGDYDSPDVPFATNVQGTYHVFEAARKQGGQRLVLMGSAPVHLDWRQEKNLMLEAGCPASDGPDHLYDLTKCLQEEIARSFASTFGLETIVLRAGHVVDGRAETDPRGRPLREVTYCRGGWVCRYDLAEAVLRSLEKPGGGFEAYNVVGARAAEQVFNTLHTENSLGMQFTRRFEDYGPD